MASKLSGIPYPKANSNLRDTVSHQAKIFSQTPRLSTYNNAASARCALAADGLRIAARKEPPPPASTCCLQQHMTEQVSGSALPASTGEAKGESSAPWSSAQRCSHACQGLAWRPLARLARDASPGCRQSRAADPFGSECRMLKPGTRFFWRRATCGQRINEW